MVGRRADCDRPFVLARVGCAGGVWVVECARRGEGMRCGRVHSAWNVPVVLPVGLVVIICGQFAVCGPGSRGGRLG